MKFFKTFHFINKLTITSSVTGFEKMSAAVASLATSSATSSSGMQFSPKRKMKPVCERDQFDSFGDMVASRLRSLDNKDVTDFMAAISGLLFRQNDRFTYLNR